MCCSFYVYMTLVYGSALGLGKLRRFYIVKRGYIRDPGSRLSLSWRPHVLQATSPCGQRVNHSNTRGLVSSLFFSRSEITAALSLHFQHLLWRLKAKRFKTYSKEEALYIVHINSYNEHICTEWHSQNVEVFVTSVGCCVSDTTLFIIFYHLVMNVKLI
jgi:hypothetical protein